jgi:hypothetical protein
MNSTDVKTKTIFVNGQECQVKEIHFHDICPSRSDVSEAWDEWLYGTTPESLIAPECLTEGFQSPEDAICHFLTDVIDNNPFGLDQEKLEAINIDYVGSLLLAYCQDRLQSKD